MGRRSMSNQFYEYVTKKINGHFLVNTPKPGDKYFLQLEEESHVQYLKDYLEKEAKDQVKAFEYKLNGVTEYETITIDYGTSELIIATQSEGIQPDFFVKLRNLVSEQEEEGINRSLLVIYHGQLDSIDGGGANLQKEGMPLNPQKILEELKHELKQMSENKGALVEVINFHLKEIEEEFNSFKGVSFFDFEEILSLMQKTELSKKDFLKLRFFHDQELDSFIQTSSKKEIRERLRENRDLYEFVQESHFNETTEAQLPKKFNEQGVNKLKHDHWNELTLQEVIKLKAEKNKKVFELEEVTNVNDHSSVAVWDRPHKTTKTGKRIRYIAIFNPSHEKEISLKFKYLIEGKGVRKSLEQSQVKIEYCNPLLEVTSNVKTNNLNLTITSNQVQNTAQCTVKYKVKNENTLYSELNIMFFPFSSEVLKDYAGTYEVKRLKENDTEYLTLGNKEGELRLGDGSHEPIFQEQSLVKVSEEPNVTYHFDQDLFEEDQFMQLVVGESQPINIKLSVDASKPHPIPNIRLYKEKREKRASIVLSTDGKLILKNQIYYPQNEYKDFLDYEMEWVNQSMQTAVLSAGVLSPIDLEFGSYYELREAYNLFLNHFKIKKTVPMLAYWDDEYKRVALNYVQAYVKAIESIQEADRLFEVGHSILRLGVLFNQKEQIVYFTPFHPVNVAFQLELNNQLGEEEISESVLKRLRADALAPYLWFDGKAYKAESQSDLPEWMVYRAKEEVVVAEADRFLSEVVKEKLNQFVDHFTSLFNQKNQVARAPLYLNVIEIRNDEMVLKGIVEWIFRQLKDSYEKNRGEVIPVEVRLYCDSGRYRSAFDQFAAKDFMDDDWEQFEYLYALIPKNFILSPQEVAEKIQSLINHYHIQNEHFNDFDYAHISFYKMSGEEQVITDKMEYIKSGNAMNGLYSTLAPTVKDGQFSMGFGLRGYAIEEEDLLLRCAKSFNELNVHMKDNGSSSFAHGVTALASITDARDGYKLQNIYESSHWVTLIEPTVDLGYFSSKQGNPDNELIIIHYNDQSSSYRYDAITVTKKTAQYQAVIKDYLNHEKPDLNTDESIKEIIQTFNVINGEWLLSMIQQGLSNETARNVHKSREKFSLLAAVKYSLAMFTTDDITWVPISLEEILRVAKAIGLNHANSPFTVKALGKSGSYSDDLLLIGMQETDGKLKMHFYPIEVKIGRNLSNVIDKARNQVVRTKSLFDFELGVGETETTFSQQYYRMFFAHLFLANAKKLFEGKLWSEREKNYDFEQNRLSVIERLMKGEYEISNELTEYFNKGVVVSFRTEETTSSIERVDDDILLLNLPEQYGISGGSYSIEEIRQSIIDGKKDIPREEMLETFKINNI